MFMRGFRGYRRNEESPFRALTPFFLPVSSQLHILSRNEESPFRALTHYEEALARGFDSVEMKRARLGR